MPAYRQDSLSAQRHGVDFDGVDDHLTDSDDIWSGASVDQAEILLVASADDEIKSFVYSSIGTSQKVRISSHIPWNNGVTYFDQGFNCCAGAGGAPTSYCAHYPFTAVFLAFYGATEYVTYRSGRHCESI